MRRILPPIEFPALAGLALALVSACVPPDTGVDPATSQLDANLLLTAEQALEWHAAKDAGGGLGYREVGEALEPTGLVEHSMLHVTNNDHGLDGRVLGDQRWLGSIRRAALRDAVAVMTQLTAVLMGADLSELAAEPDDP